MLFRNAPVLTAPPSVRRLPEPLEGGTQTRLLRTGDQLFQINTDQVHQVDTVRWQNQVTPLDPHPDNTAIYHPATVTEDGRALYVSQSQKRILSVKDGEVEPVVDLTGAKFSVVSDLTMTPEGTLYFGTSDAHVNIQHADGQLELPVVLPYRRSGGSFIYSSPQTILPAKNGCLYVGTHEGVVGFDEARQPKWIAPAKTIRACDRDRLNESPDGSKIYYTGADRSIRALDARTGELLHEQKLLGDAEGEGDCFNEAKLDAEGNVYTVSGGGVLFKLSPSLEVLWKKPVGVGIGSVVTNARIEFDQHENVCVNPNTESFHVYSPDGLLLLRMEGPDVFDGGRYAFDFALSEQGDKAFIRTLHEGKNTLAEVTLPGAASELLEQMPADTGGSGVRETSRQVTVGGSVLPRRRA